MAFYYIIIYTMNITNKTRWLKLWAMKISTFNKISGILRTEDSLKDKGYPQ